MLHIHVLRKWEINIKFYIYQGLTRTILQQMSARELLVNMNITQLEVCKPAAKCYYNIYGR